MLSCKEKGKNGLSDSPHLRHDFWLRKLDRFNLPREQCAAGTAEGWPGNGTLSSAPSGHALVGITPHGAALQFTGSPQASLAHPPSVMLVPNCCHTCSSCGPDVPWILYLPKGSAMPTRGTTDRDITSHGVAGRPAQRTS